MGSQPLKNTRWEKFVQILVKGSEIGPAYTAAGYSSKGKSANTAGGRLLDNVDIQDRLNFLKEQAADECILTRREALRILSDRARGSLSDFLDVTPGGEVRFRTDGDGTVDPAKVRCLKKLKSRFEPTVDAGGEPGLATIVETEVWDALAAIQEIAKLEGWYPNPKLDLENAAGQVVQLVFADATQEDIDQLKADADDDLEDDE